MPPKTVANMAPRGQRIQKACQECRKRKIRCTPADDSTPCSSCRVHKTDCVYRQSIRTRTRVTKACVSDISQRGHSADTSSVPPSVSSSKQFRHEAIYHSVSATHDTAHSGTLQLYYGASSNFAFLQHLYQSLLLGEGPETVTPGEVQEGGAGLDLFNQRSIFFGSAAASNKADKADKADEADEGDEVVLATWDTLPAELLELFLDTFFDTHYHLMCFLREDEIRLTAHSIYDTKKLHNIQSGQRAVTFAVLANGAIATAHMRFAEPLLTAARAAADGFDEVVNLHSVHFSIAMAVYHSTVGHPNQAYLHLGSASRKAYAMGLHKDIHSGDGDQKSVQQRRTTVWCLYFHECWISLTLGRACSMNRADISCPLPENKTFISQSTRLLDIGAQGAKMMYGHRRLPLWESWKAAESIHTELRAFAEDNGLAFARRQHHFSVQPMQHLTLTSFYYHTILITFRPFLIVAAVRKRQRHFAEGIPMSTPEIIVPADELWLREACRYAVDAARDQLSSISSSMSETDVCQRLKYNGFFIESSCAVLLYDSLSNHHTYSHNLEYIKVGLQCLENIVSGGPIATAKASIERILALLQQKLAVPSAHVATPLDSASATVLPDNRGRQQAHSEPLISQLVENVTSTWNQGGQMNWGLDIFTTDLNEFFPLNDFFDPQFGVVGNYGNPYQQDFQYDPREPS